MSGTSVNVIEVRDVSKRFVIHRDKSLKERAIHAMRKEKKSNDFWALRDVSFDVQPGEVLGIIGRNGAGKSTLLKILSRITEPTTGEIHLRGRVGSLLEVGTGFHPELSGRDNIFLNGAILGMTHPEIARKFDEIVEFAEVGKFIDTPVKRYSSGMYVRLAFAIAAHLEPEILIVDEVLAVGDAQFQRKCIGRMQEISHGHGRTILFVSHAMPTIRRLCRKCAVLEGGRLLGVFPVDEAIELYNRNIGPSGLDIDVSTRSRDWGAEGRVARIQRVRVISEHGLRFNESFNVSVEIEAAERVDQAMLGFAFNTVEGQRILTLDSDAEGRTFTLPPGRSTLEVSLPRLPLHPGRYYCSTSLGQGKHFLDVIDGYALWEVHSGRNDWETDRGYGGCRLSPTVAVVSP